MVKTQIMVFSKNQYITNNLSESFKEWIVEARHMSAVDLADQIRYKLMLKQRRCLRNKWKGQQVPYVERYV